jgi:glycosyltransferase involved in cell wall biosynthesis
MLQRTYEQVELFHVRMNFSKEMDQRGKLSIDKIFHLIHVVLNIYWLKFKFGISILYYPPSNSPRISIYRDAIILFFTRFLFKRVIFHFHAAGISEELCKMNSIQRFMLYSCLRRPDLSITSSVYNPKDGEFLESKKCVTIPLGIPEVNGKKVWPKNEDGILRVLFVGLLNSTKGEVYLLDAIRSLIYEGERVKLIILGKFESDLYKSIFFEKVNAYSLNSVVDYRGVVIGEEKEKVFKECDLFCFPSFFISESFGIVLLEAMQNGLPIIGTSWRGIKSIVRNNKNGFLVSVKNSEEIKNAILYFIRNPNKVKEFGLESRKIYEEEYTLERYLKQLELEFSEL